MTFTEITSNNPSYIPDDFAMRHFPRNGSVDTIRFAARWPASIGVGCVPRVALVHVELGPDGSVQSAPRIKVAIEEDPFEAVDPIPVHELVEVGFDHKAIRDTDDMRVSLAILAGLSKKLDDETHLTSAQSEDIVKAIGSVSRLCPGSVQDFPYVTSPVSIGSRQTART